MTLDSRFRERAGLLGDLAVWTSGFLMVAIAVDAAWVAIGKRAFGFGGGDFRDTLHALGLELASALGAIFLVIALSRLGRVFARMRDGATLIADNAAGLVACGSAIVTAALAQLVISPTLIAWISRDGPFRIDWEWQTVALGLLGGAIALLGDVTRAGAAARAELDEIV